MKNKTANYLDHALIDSGLLLETISTEKALLALRTLEKKYKEFNRQNNQNYVLREELLSLYNDADRARHKGVISESEILDYLIPYINNCTNSNENWQELDEKIQKCKG